MELPCFCRTTPCIFVVIVNTLRTVFFSFLIMCFYRLWLGSLLRDIRTGHIHIRIFRKLYKASFLCKTKGIEYEGGGESDFWCPFFIKKCPFWPILNVDLISFNMPSRKQNIQNGALSLQLNKVG